MLDITKEELQKELQGTDLLVLDFYGPTCGPCKKIVPLLEEFEKKNTKGVKFFKVNAFDQFEICKDYGVSALPTLLFIKHHRERARVLFQDMTRQNIATLIAELRDGILD